MPLEKPRNQPSLLLDVVPVLPATGRPSAEALVPVPSETTEVSASVTLAATFSSMVCSPFAVAA